jgi:hypothetical protein
LAWCIEHSIVLRQFRVGEIYLLFWENLCEQPELELEQVFKFLGKRYDGYTRAVVQEPSLTTSKGTREAIASGRNLLDLWRTEVSKEQVQWCLQALDVFGLAQIYSDDPRPNVAGALALMQCNE